MMAVVDGGDDDGGLLLYVDGPLSGLEYWWDANDEPGESPPADAIGRSITH